MKEKENMSEEDKNELIEEVYDKLMKYIKKENTSFNTECLEKNLMDNTVFDKVKVEMDKTDDPYDYKLKVQVRLPPFVPCIDCDTGELWYVCTRKDVDLRYCISDDKYILQSSDEELLDFILDADEINGVKQ